MINWVKGVCLYAWDTWDYNMPLNIEVQLPLFVLFCRSVAWWADLLISKQHLKMQFIHAVYSLFIFKLYLKHLCCHIHACWQTCPWIREAFHNCGTWRLQNTPLYDLLALLRNLGYIINYRSNLFYIKVHYSLSFLWWSGDRAFLHVYSYKGSCCCCIDQVIFIFVIFWYIIRR